jgi:hypothetical protein
MDNGELPDVVQDVYLQTSMQQADFADIEDRKVGKKKEDWLLGPENAEIWHLGKKIYHLAVVGMQCFIV